MADIEFTQGEDVELTLTLFNEEEVLIDITGDTFEAKIKDIDDLDTELGTFTFSIPVGTDGVVVLLMASAVSLEVPSTVQYDVKGKKSTTPSRVLMYDVFRTRTSDSNRRCIATGLVEVYPSISM